MKEIFLFSFILAFKGVSAQSLSWARASLARLDYHMRSVMILNNFKEVLIEKVHSYRLMIYHYAFTASHWVWVVRLRCSTP